MAEFKVGNEVQLKSGGPIMTVENIGTYGGKPGVLCTWFKDDKPEQHVFVPEALKLYEGD